MLFVVVSLLSWASSDAHSHISKVVGPLGQTACPMHAPADCTPTNNLRVRESIVRSGGNPPGDEQSYNCDHCSLERVNVPGTCIDQYCAKWWTNTPAFHWELDSSKPAVPCMSRDVWGARGSMEVAAGDTLSTTNYINADHSGLYQWQIACTATPSNADFQAITPWKALHIDKDGVDLSSTDRVVGYTKAETDAFYAGTDCSGAKCAYRMNRNSAAINSANCLNNPDDCFYSDTFTVPIGTCPAGEAVLRWMWNSGETPEVYSNCLDLMLSGDGTTRSPTFQTFAPTPLPLPTCSGATRTGLCGGITDSNQCGSSHACDGDCFQCQWLGKGRKVNCGQTIKCEAPDAPTPTEQEPPTQQEGPSCSCAGRDRTTCSQCQGCSYSGKDKVCI